MKNRYLLAVALAVLCPVGASTLCADVFYFGLQNIAIPIGSDPTAINGVYVNLQTGVVANPTFTNSPNWDINPFLGGDGVATSPNFRPARTGPGSMGNQDPIANLGFGTAVNSNLQTYSNSYGGSQGHIGNNANQFQANTPGYIGYQYTPAGSGMTYSGWMRAILNQNTAGGMLMDWAYETTPGASIAAGDIQQAAPVAGVSVVTLTAAAGETPRLGSVLADGGGNAYSTSLQKVGAGKWTLGAANTYSGATTINGGTLEAAVANAMQNTSSITVNNGGTLLLSNNSTTDHINNAATVTLAAGSTFNTGGVSEYSNPTTPPLVLQGPSAALQALQRANVLPRQEGDSRFRLRYTRFEPRNIVQPQHDLSVEMPLDDNDAPRARRFSAPSVFSAGLGALTLQGTAMLPVTIDFGAFGAGSTLVFASLLNSAGAYVNILNWTGIAGGDTGSPTNNRLLFVSNPSLSQAALANFNFAGFANGGTIISYNGNFEIVPVPEPGTWAAGLLVLITLVGTQRRRIWKRASGATA